MEWPPNSTGLILLDLLSGEFKKMLPSGVSNYSSPCVTLFNIFILVSD